MRPHGGEEDESQMWGRFVETLGRNDAGMAGESGRPRFVCM
jgi:hypothetical protein